uniref:Uncharacterized protein n=1 Tax=Rhizophora mucronata TaxID=61149 RepID=A0A2P2P905_RHIMU
MYLMSRYNNLDPLPLAINSFLMIISTMV